MRPDLKRTLRQFQKQIQLEDQVGDDEERREALAQREAIRLRREMLATGIPLQFQHRLLDLQRNKNRVFLELQRDFQRIEEGEAVAESGGEAERAEEALLVSLKHGQLTVSWKGHEIPVTTGMLVADLDWQHLYHLDPATVPVRVRKRYALERSKLKLRKLLQEQIAIYEGENPKLEAHLGRAVKGGARQSSSEHVGFLAERLVYSFMKWLELDGRARFKAHRADAYHDILLKVDFLLSISDQPPSVTSPVQQKPLKPMTKPVYGYQITTGALEEKTDSIREGETRVQKDLRAIIPVHIAPEWVNEAYLSWQELGKPPGGPYLFLTPVQAKRILYAFTGELLTEEEQRILHTFLDGAYEQHQERQKTAHTAYQAEGPEKESAIEQQRLRQQIERQQEKRHRSNLLEGLSARFDGLDEKIKRCIIEERLDDFDPEETPLIATQAEALHQETEEIKRLRSSFEQVYPDAKTAYEYRNHFFHFEKRNKALESAAETYALVAHVYREEAQAFKTDPDTYLETLEDGSWYGFIAILTAEREGRTVRPEAFQEEHDQLRERLRDRRVRISQALAANNLEEALKHAQVIGRSIFVYGLIKRMMGK